MPHARFDRSRLTIRPLAERSHDLDLSRMLPLDGPVTFDHPAIAPLAAAIVAARRFGRPVILMLGGHVIRAGCGPLIIDLLERGLITLVAGNGAVAIHDYELALIGATTESVARYIRTGEFGLWAETGAMCDVVAAGRADGLGYGEAIGRAVADGDFPHRQVSVAAACWRLGVPFTVHVGLGYDIIHEHPNCDGAALGAASYDDFLIYCAAIEQLEGGVMLCFGSAVMGPEVYLKALSMARNVARREGRSIARFTTGVFDLLELGGDLTAEAPKSDPRYYYRPYKTILVRTTADGGTSYYVRGDHRETFPALRAAVLGEQGEQA